MLLSMVGEVREIVVCGGLSEANLLHDMTMALLWGKGAITSAIFLVGARSLSFLVPSNLTHHVCVSNVQAEY